MEDIQPDCAYVLRVSMKANGRIVENTWPFWIFDSSKLNQVSAPDESKAESDTHEAVFITSERFHAETLLNEGKRVLFELPYEDTSYDCPPVRFNPSFWNSQMGPTWARGMGMIIKLSLIHI